MTSYYMLQSIIEESQGSHEDHEDLESGRTSTTYILDPEDLKTTRSEECTMESTTESRSVRLPVSDGAHKDFQVRPRTRLVAFAAVYSRIIQILKIGGEANMPADKND
jgi:hypothetical protein